MVARIVERVAGRYEVGKTEFGRAYRWCFGRVVLECGCGERSVFTGSATTCGCGVNHAAIIQEGADAERLGTKLSAPGGMLGIARMPGYLIERASATRLAPPPTGTWQVALASR